MRNCIIPGSFDPVTAGHVSLFETAAKIFDNVYPVILVNTEKRGGMFTSDERFEILKAAVDSIKLRGITNVEAKLYSGLTTDAAREFNCSFIVKGVRNTTDFAYENDLSHITLRFDPEIETVLLPSKAELVKPSTLFGSAKYSKA